MILEWLTWIKINESSNYSKCAIYRIRICSKGKPEIIQRFLGKDGDGLLCIGKTTDMERRRKQFVRGLTGVFGHSEANLLHILETVSPLGVMFKEREYEYSYARIAKGDEDKAEEAEIKAYVKRFGEVPPLNSAIPDRYGDW
ncbi:MAG: hypothetical protein C0410_01775 [Anaerolinea sp.]|nr:hypothetical protein [Anaerolinea sp.]